MSAIAHSYPLFLETPAVEPAVVEPSVVEPSVADAEQVAGTRAFLDAIFEIELQLDLDRRAALEAFPAALALATDADWWLLDFMVEQFTLHPREAALRRMDALWRHADDLGQERMLALVPDTDPGLHSRSDHDLNHLLETRARRNGTTVEDEQAKLEVQLIAAEMPRQSIRTWYNPLPRLSLAPTKRVDASRLRPEQIRARVAARGRRRRAEVEPSIVTTYVRESLFVDTEVADQARLRQRWAELAARGITPTAPAPRGWTPRRPGERPPLPAELSAAIWDHQYCAHVADQRDHERALAGESVKSPEHSHAWAAERTGLRSRGDRREAYLFQGNGLDDFRTAMTPVAGWQCVSCFVERPSADQRPVHARGGVLRSDDGLCDYCRADGRTGLPELAPGFTGADLAATYCAYFAQHYRDSACALLGEVCRRAPQWLTAVIDRFLANHPDLPGAPVLPDVDDEQVPVPTPTRPRRQQVLPPGQRPGKCEGCTKYMPVHDDGFCTTCRVYLGLHVPTPRVRRLVAA
ncbi:hypothetical protein ACFWM1_26430 [Nocardia sp. NPDC058379]|uniref:hypothetical protein n=1 Tax=unclassified Nocardia TaxID=2637762 RepID=UPI003658D5A5